jgi:hypothetical protein
MVHGQTNDRIDLSWCIMGLFLCKFIANCNAIVNGTIFPLELKSTLNGEDYFHQKSRYGVHSLLFCKNNTKLVFGGDERYAWILSSTFKYSIYHWRLYLLSIKLHGILFEENLPCQKPK